MSPLYKRILFFKPIILNKLGLEGGFKEYPITFDCKKFKKLPAGSTKACTTCYQNFLIFPKIKI